MQTKPRIAAKLSDHAKRLVQIRDLLFSGNGAKMAGAIGCSNSLLSRIARGEQEPGRRLLEAIASHQNVNATWLLTGEGEPLLKARNPDGVEGSLLPVTRALFAGSPSENELFLTGEFFPVAAKFHSHSRYWLRIEEATRGVARAWQLEPADLLLMESDRSYWKNEQHVHKRLCIFRGSTSSAGFCQFGETAFEPATEGEPPRLRADLFDGGPHDPRNDTKSLSARGKKSRQIFEHKSEFDFIRLRDIVAVAVLMMRRFD